MNRIPLLFGILLISAAMITGCGKSKGPTGSVTGKVNLASGASPEGLLVRFINESSGVGATSIVGSDGSYSLKHKGESGVPIGAFRISVTAYVKEMSDKEMTAFLGAPEEERERIEAQRNQKMTLVPEKYHSEETSGLTYKIVEGKQTHDIALSE